MVDDESQIEAITAVLATLPPAERRRAMELMIQIQRGKQIEKARESFLPFVRAVWPGFIEGAHHRKMASAFERVARGELKRVIINMPPRHTKSEFASYLLPAWFLGRRPDAKIIQASHTVDLAKGFGRQVRNLIATEDYQKIFPGLKLMTDNKAAGRWSTNSQGQYFAVGVEGAVAGKGADLAIIDDPHAEAEAIAAEHNPAIYDKVYQWFTSGPRQRLQPGGAIIIVMTRWSLRDLTGQILSKATQDDAMSEWEVIELPAILPSGNPLWPEYWPLAELERVKRDIPLPKWNAQYQQQPTSDSSSIIRRDKWRPWIKKTPECEAIIQSWDTSLETTQRANYSACTTWGIFNHEGEDGKSVPNLILLDAFKGKYEFPELKQKAKEAYSQWKPDQVVVERRSSGGPLLLEMRASGLPVRDFLPVRGNNKLVRANAVSDIFESGYVWYIPSRWAEEVIEECAVFPYGIDDDYVDSTTQALLMYRQGGWIGTSMDDFDDDDEYDYHKVAAYY